MRDRRQQAESVRVEAAALAAARGSVRHEANEEEHEYRREIVDAKGKKKNTPSFIANFTKGLAHDDRGLVVDPSAYAAFVRALDSGDTDDFEAIPLGPGPFDPFGKNTKFKKGEPEHDWKDPKNKKDCVSVRAWESQGAGLTFDLEGPDAQAVTMPPAPRLDSAELAAEMAEVYWMALLRDVFFDSFGSSRRVSAARASLGDMPWFHSSQDAGLTASDLTDEARKRRRRHATRGKAPKIPLDRLFRGVTRGDDVGPYISQFLLIGNTGINGNSPDRKVTDGRISYGAITIDQRVRKATPGVDYMTTWPAWLDVQNGADVRGTECYDAASRFIATPRDLATYVHYDALYEAYLNACLLLLGMGAPFDPGIPFQDPDFRDKQQGFAHFGGPHVLSLVTEVATRALKAVRYQKFNVHRRLRPEAVGGLIERHRTAGDAELEVVSGMLDCTRLERAVKKATGGTLLLPMAFPEGSPMHPSYGAGHATVAGACVTILKAFFDTGWELPLRNGKGRPIAYQADSKSDGTKLASVALDAPLTVEGELNKLASNISIGRNWAGVHYFSDYIESIRMGEQVALGILEEQKLTYGENFSMTVPLFDGGTVRI
ncbi:MAG: vanadium-dependent haloperoxidase [Acidobacteriota bacterium]